LEKVPSSLLKQLETMGINNRPISDLKAAVVAAQTEKKIYVSRAKELSTELDVKNLKTKLKDIIDLFKDVVAKVSQSFFFHFSSCHFLSSFLL